MSETANLIAQWHKVGIAPCQGLVGQAARGGQRDVFLYCARANCRTIIAAGVCATRACTRAARTCTCPCAARPPCNGFDVVHSIDGGGNAKFTILAKHDDADNPGKRILSIQNGATAWNPCLFIGSAQAARQGVKPRTTNHQVGSGAWQSQGIRRGSRVGQVTAGALHHGHGPGNRIKINLSVVAKDGANHVVSSIHRDGIVAKTTQNIVLPGANIQCIVTTLTG